MAPEPRGGSGGLSGHVNPGVVFRSGPRENPSRVLFDVTQRDFGASLQEESRRALEIQEG
jgi:hypothetical protein